MPFKSLEHYRFMRAEEGVTALEFALVAPVLLLLMFGIVEFSLVMFVSTTMEGATAGASRLGKTGYTTQGLSRDDSIKQMIAQRTAGLIDINNLTIAKLTYSSLQNIGQQEPYTDQNGNHIYDQGEAYSDVNGNGKWDSDMGKAGAGNAGDIVVYTISYPWKIVTPIIAALIAPSGTYTISTRTVVKNEPYASVAPGGR